MSQARRHFCRSRLVAPKGAAPAIAMGEVVKDARKEVGTEE